MSAVVNIVDKIDGYLYKLAMFILVFTMLFSTTDTLLRYVANSQIPGGYEIVAEYMLPYIVFLSISYVFKEGGHIRVTMLTRLLPKKVQDGLMLMSHILSIVLVLILTYASYFKAHGAYLIGEYSSSILAYLLWPAFTVLVFGYGFLALRLIITIITRENPYSDGE
ncbi:TRAP transporter small permease [Bacillus sp. V3B]|uniref:TRAP transporter small permease subunit n=1 Tax=Bacillus sp. V3B TaxID=2804915 RepID=UPI00210D0161|nr:TRAP transporter small permease [Bacillus sp. V3B]MCQ6275377.1 TRAP transporter small permease [Bacillus sp. V3B]